MFEIHKMLFEAAKAFAFEGGFINTIISSLLFAFDIWYLMHLFSIPFYIRDIAKGVRRK